MKIFQLWIVFNSCVFMMIYFLTFLLLKYNYVRSALICTIGTAFATIQEVFRIYYLFDAVWPKIFVTAANIVTVQACAMVLAKKKDSYTLFIGFSSSIFVLAGNITSCAVLLLSQNYFFAMAVCTLVNAAVFLCMNGTIREICRTILSKEITIWMCVIPAMYYITFFLMLYFPVFFSQRPESLFSACSLLITVVVMYVLLIQYIYAKSGEKNLLWRNRELHAYIHGIEFQSEAAQVAVQDLKILRHDMRHKDQLLIELLNSQKYDEAKQILRKHIEYIDHTQIAVYSENIVLNSILSGMAKKAKKLGVHLQISCAVPKQQEINDYDLAIVTANLIENAVQAAAKQPPGEHFVLLTIKNRTGKNFFLEIKNPCHETVRFSKRTGLPVSAQGSEHGYGMKSVQDFVHKYRAQFDCFIEQHTFVVRILVPLP